MKSTSDVRPSPIAGTWYSSDPNRLGAQVDAYLRRAALPDLQGEVIALIAPHAGHRYSGPTAGYAFRAVQQQHFDLVAVLSPLHSFFPSPLVTSAHPAYGTPLGIVPVDREALLALDEALERATGTGMAAVAHDGEHALEIELPFLQRALDGNFQLLPIMVRTMSPGLLQALAVALANVVRGQKVLLIASTDLSHFYPKAKAEALDAEMLSRMAAISPEGVLEAENTNRGFACGAGAVAAVLWAARELGADTAKVLHHSNSGDVTGEFESVVGYGAVAILKTHDNR